VTPVPADQLPRSFHHVIQGRDGALYASSFLTNEVFRAAPDEKGANRWVLVVGRGQGLDGPTGLALDEQSSLYVSSFGTDQILRFNSVTGDAVDVFVNDEEGKLDCPEGLLHLGDRLLVASFCNDRILSYNADGSLREIFASGGYLDGPQTMLEHPATHSILISTYHRDKVVAVDASSGKKRREFGGRELSRPVGLAASPFDMCLVASHKSNEILRYNASTGEFVDVFASGHGLWAPTGIAMSSDLVLSVGTFTDGLRRYSFWR
jgi:hypothetical protein